MPNLALNWHFFRHVSMRWWTNILISKSELTIWRTIQIHRKDNVTTEAASPELSAIIDEANSLIFPLPDRPLPSKMRFKRLQIDYIDHSVIAFLRSNHQIFDKKGTNLRLSIPPSYAMDDYQPIWDVLTREIWPILSTNIRHLCFTGGDLDILRRLISPTILIDLLNLNSIDLFELLSDSIGDGFDEQNGTNGQLLSKWLHIPRKDGQPKRLRCGVYSEQWLTDWVNDFKEHFLRANAISSVSYEIHFTVRATSIVPFELVNECTKEKLTLIKDNENELDNRWIMKRCKISGEKEEKQQKDENWDNNCNSVFFWLVGGNDCIGPLSPPPEEEKDEAGQSITNGSSSSADK